MAKRLTVDTLRERRERVEDRVLRLRTVLESHRIERERLYSAENKRRLTPQALREDEGKLRVKTHASLAKWRGEIVDTLGDSFTHREQWSREAVLRNARFFPEYVGVPGTIEAKMTMLMSELLESTRRNGAEHRAARFTPQDLAAEAERAATEGDIATVSVLINEAKSRRLQGEEKLNVDLALKRLELPESTEAEQLYGDLESLIDESDALLSIWANPRDEMALSRESLARFNRKKRAEKLIAEVEAEGQRQEAEKAKAKLQAAIPMPVDNPIEPEQSSAA